MNLSIIIINWNVRDLLKKCLESIFRETKQISFEVFVVDNNSSDGSPEMLKELAARSLTPPNLPLDKGRNGGVGLHLILNKENMGFAKANNQALREVRGEFVLFLNPDTEILPPHESSPSKEGEEQGIQTSSPSKEGEDRGGGALDKLVALMRSRSDIAALACKLVNADGSLQRNIKRHPTFWSQVLIMIKLHHLFSEVQPLNIKRLNLLDYYLAKDFDYSREQEVEQVMGAFFLTRRNLLEKLASERGRTSMHSAAPHFQSKVGGERRRFDLDYGAWDEDYWLWWEDVQLCVDFARRGWKIIYTPIAEVLHHEGKSFAQVRHLDRQRRFNRGTITYFKKNGRPWQVIILKILDPFSLVLAFLAQFLRIKPRPQSRI